MAWSHAHWIESAVDSVAAAIFAAAVAFALHATALDAGPIATAGAAAGFVLAWAGLRRVSVEETAYALPDFQLPAIEPQESVAGELLLEDTLIGVEADARVVQLFHPRQLPPADNEPQTARPDASAALSEALEQLRRSLQ